MNNEVKIAELEDSLDAARKLIEVYEKQSKKDKNNLQRLREEKTENLEVISYLRMQASGWTVSHVRPNEPGTDHLYAETILRAENRLYPQFPVFKGPLSRGWCGLEKQVTEFLQLATDTLVGNGEYDEQAHW